MIRALVTGAGGFIGGHLVQRLVLDGCEVMAVDKKPVMRWEQDPPTKGRIHLDALTWVRDIRPDDIEAADVIYHLASDMGGVEFTSTQHLACCDNIVDTLHLAKYTRSDQRLFYSSTACVYPIYRQEQPDVDALAESIVWPYDPEPGYGFEKLYAEHVLGFAAVERGVEVRIARYHNVYGPHGTWKGGREKAPAALCRKIATAKLTKADSITVYGDGEQTRSFMYIADCIHGTKLITNSEPVAPLVKHRELIQPFNLGSSELVSINHLTALIMSIAGVNLRVEHDLSGPQGVRGRNSDNTLIKDTFGWEPNTPLLYGLAKTYEWIYDQVKRELKL